MANESTPVNLGHNGGNPQDFTVGDGCSISKGDLLRMLDGRTASGVPTAGGACAGIATSDKVANDGATEVSCYQEGIHDMYASGAIIIGSPVSMDLAPNHIKLALNTASGAHVIGSANETSSDGEKIEVRLNLN